MLAFVSFYQLFGPLPVLRSRFRSTTAYMTAYANLPLLCYTVNMAQHDRHVDHDYLYDVHAESLCFLYIRVVAFVFLVGCLPFLLLIVTFLFSGILHCAFPR